MPSVVKSFYMVPIADDSVEYLGIDIVPSLVQEASLRFMRPTVRFIHADAAALSEIPLPRPAQQRRSTSLIFSRQMMQHQCNKDVRSSRSATAR